MICRLLILIQNKWLILSNCIRITNTLLAMMNEIQNINGKVPLESLIIIRHVARALCAEKMFYTNFGLERISYVKPYATTYEEILVRRE